MPKDPRKRVLTFFTFALGGAAAFWMTTLLGPSVAAKADSEDFPTSYLDNEKQVYLPLTELVSALEEGSASVAQVMDVAGMLVACVEPPEPGQRDLPLVINGQRIGHLVFLPLESGGIRTWEFDATIPSASRYQSMAENTRVGILCRGEQGSVVAVMATAKTHIHSSAPISSLIGTKPLVIGGNLSANSSVSRWQQETVTVERVGGEILSTRRLSKADVRPDGLLEQPGLRFLQDFLYSQ